MANVIEIQSFSDPALDVYARLTENQLVNRADPENALFIAESPNVIHRALDAGCVPVSMLLERKHIEGQAKEIIARCGEIPIYTSTLEVLTQLRPAPEEILREARRIAVLENIMNPTNLGAIFRSAAALNMDAVLLTPACTDALYRRCVRVSMGTVFQIPWTYLDRDWPEPGMTFLRSLGFKTAAMALRDESVSVDDPGLMAEPKLALILGTEGDGLADATIADCDYTVKIPMSHGVDSLNVAAASAVAFYQLCKPM